jgi:hypothetical protein
MHEVVVSAGSGRAVCLETSRLDPRLDIGIEALL